MAFEEMSRATDPTLEMPAGQAPAPEPVIEEVTMEPPASKEPWYQKVGRSLGASIGVFAGALVAIALVSGGASYAGTQLALDGDMGKSAPMEQQRDGGDRGQGFGSKSESSPMDRDSGGFSGKSQAPDSDAIGGKSQAPDGEGSVGKAPKSSTQDGNGIQGQEKPESSVPSADQGIVPGSSVGA